MSYLVIVLYCFFFFKQKTAYEMRISDWSSDVCSSDLCWRHRWFSPSNRHFPLDCQDILPRWVRPFSAPRSASPRPSATPIISARGWRCCARITVRSSAPPARRPRPRSEEHTSELQSLMRISYAVFCLKNTNTTHKIHVHDTY